MFRALAATLVLLAYGGAAAAQSQSPAAPRAATEPSAYCRSGAAAVLTSAGDAEIASVQQVCKRGDVIAINNASQGSIFAVGRLCDFSKAIVNTSGQTVCVLASARPVR